MLSGGIMINKTFNDLMDSIKELHNKKNHDYAIDFNAHKPEVPLQVQQELMQAIGQDLVP